MTFRPASLAPLVKRMFVLREYPVAHAPGRDRWRRNARGPRRQTCRLPEIIGHRSRDQVEDRTGRRRQRRLLRRHQGLERRTGEAVIGWRRRLNEDQSDLGTE